MTGLSLLESASASFREQRMHRFVRDFGITRDTRLLDVGGTLYNWTLAPVSPKITILNRVHCDAPHAAADWVLGDGCTLLVSDRDPPVESLRALSPQALAGRHGQALDGVGRADRHC